MRTLAIGDIHGCLTALDTLLRVVAPAAGDVLVTLGDYVDRGPDSRGVLDRLIALSATHRLVPLRGNHDQMMLDARRGGDALQEWLACGGDAALRSYGATLADVSPAHWDFLENRCRPYYETDTHFFVHANVYPKEALDEQPEYILYWERLRDFGPHVSGKVMVCGHTSQKSGLPLDLGHAVCIDTFAHGTGWLTCLEPTTGRLWQANQQGRTRAGWLGGPLTETA